MADIDKSLPNVRTNVEIPGPDKDIIVQQQEKLTEPPIEVTPMEDGGVELNFEPGRLNIPGTEKHFDNLAELLPDDILDPMGNEMQGNYTDYKMSRKDWEESYVKGLDLLGFKYENRSEPFQGASGATHPVLAEAVTQFQAGAYKELLPAEGPVRTQILGVSNLTCRFIPRWPKFPCFDLGLTHFKKGLTTMSCTGIILIATIFINGTKPCFFLTSKMLVCS